MPPTAIASTPLAAFLIAQPGKPDLIAAFPEGAATTDVLAQLRHIATGDFRLGVLDVGDFQIGRDNPRPATPLPVSESAIHSDAATRIEALSRALWRVQLPGQPDQIMITVPEISVDWALEIARNTDPRASVEAVGAGTYPVRQILSCYRRDGRWLDEKGYVQLEVPCLPSISGR